MTATDSGRILRAFAFAPLNGPLAVFLGALARSAAHHSVVPGAPPNGVGAVLFFLWLFVLFGAPLAYVASFVVLWPATVMLRRMDLVRWWTVTGVAMIGGAVLLPLYEQVLMPRGTFDIFPGAGLVAGAAVGLSVWLLAFRQGSTRR
jgi:hypothetical protein